MEGEGNAESVLLLGGEEEVDAIFITCVYPFSDPHTRYSSSELASIHAFNGPHARGNKMQRQAKIPYLKDGRITIDSLYNPLNCAS